MYVLCIATSFGCAALLLRSYRERRVRLLLWSGLCFAALTANNVLVFVDLVLLPESDLRAWRLATTTVGLTAMLYGFVLEADRG